MQLSFTKLCPVEHERRWQEQLWFYCREQGHQVHTYPHAMNEAKLKSGALGSCWSTSQLLWVYLSFGVISILLWKSRWSTQRMLRCLSALIGSKATRNFIDLDTMLWLKTHNLFASMHQKHLFCKGSHPLHQASATPSQYLTAWVNFIPHHCHQGPIYHSGVSVDIVPWPTDILAWQGNYKVVRFMYLPLLTATMHPSGIHLYREPWDTGHLPLSLWLPQMVPGHL